MNAVFRMRLVVLGLFCAAVVGCRANRCVPCDEAGSVDGHAAHAASDSKTREYYALPGLDHGLLQSPVNVLSNETAPGRHEIDCHGRGEASEVANLGTTVKLSIGKGNTTDFDGNSYEFQQLHFHTPAEHLIDGITYPMEMHLVHSRPGPVAGAPPSYLVISLLMRMGKPNRFLAEFLDAVPAEPGKSAELHGVFFGHVFPPGLDLEHVHYYHYKGSLTTPPYTESVDWLIAKEVIEAAPKQIQRINLIEGDNARHVQALYSRAIDQ